MAVLASIATGNLTSASTWGLVDSTSYLNAENATESLLTTAYSGTRSAGFTPGAITVSHIGVKLAERIGTTGTMSVELYNNTGAAAVAGTEVTIDVADLPSALEADLNGGWIFFKLASPVTLAGATSYSVEAKTSSTSQVDLWCDATVDNLARALITTTTQAPVAGDDMIIAGEYVDASTFNTFVVTMDETATTDYGAASTSLVTPAIAICNGGTLQYGTTAATNYILKISGHIIVYSGGIFNIGTTGTPIPRDGTATLEFDCGANIDFGLIVRNLGTWNAQGLSRTSGKDIVQCLLNTDEAANSTSLGVDTDTGWLDNDEIAIASTSRTASECEKGTLNGNAGASSLTVDGFAGTGGGLAFAHSGTSPTQAEIILLTRNIKIRGASATLQSFIEIRPTAIVDLDWAEFYWLGSATTNRRGIDINTTTGSFSCHYCSVHNNEVSSSRGLNLSGSSGNGYTVAHFVSYLVNSDHISVNGTSNTTWSVTYATCIRNNNTSAIVTIGDGDGTATYIRVAGCNAASGFGAINFTDSGAAGNGVFTNLIAHSNTATGIGWSQGIINHRFVDCVIYRSNSTGLILSGVSSWTNMSSNVEFDGLEIFGCATNSIAVDLTIKFVNYTLKGVISNGDTTFSTTNGLQANSSNGGLINVTFINCDFGTVGGIKTAHTNDLNFNNTTFVELYMYNTRLASATEIASVTNLLPNSIITSQRHDQIAGNHKTWKKYGIITIDTTVNMYRTAAPSERLTPNNASNKLTSGFKKVPVGNGQTVTINTYVRESVVGDGTDYNGNRPRLILKRNDAMGISTDTVIDTATASAEGAFELLTGTTAAVTDDGVLEFYVDCDGTTGWVNVDDWSATLA